MPNKLSLEKSPYLLQHQHNPVHWYPWGNEAFEKARREDKPIFLSIGYSTCYWCHVMERECFERDDVAEVLNRSCISIKVDREERPDIDQIYMDAVVALHGHGGWPLSCFLTPDLQTFFGGTYFPREQFLALLSRVSELWAEQRERVKESANSILEVTRSGAEKIQAVNFDESVYEQAFRQLSSTFDPKYGGFGAAPKFPQTSPLSLLLRINRRSKVEEALLMVEKTLDQMAAGGMRDHLGGGFHRYSTDEKWLAPHFEKMLYDNALLASVYLEAYTVNKKEAYALAASETLDYLLREMLAPEGGFYSAQDAGDVGKEGEYYVWSYAELVDFLKEDELKSLQDIYQISPEGNFESGLNILALRDASDLEVKSSSEISSISKKLLDFRRSRHAPHLDDKILSSWNGLAIAALARGARVLGDSKYLAAAEGAAEFIKSTMWKDKQLYARYREEETRFPAYLDDYAFLIHGLLELYQTNYDPSCIHFANELQCALDASFWDEEGKGYFFTDGKDSSVISRKKQFHDGALPSGNSVSARNLLQLSSLLLKPEYRKQAEEVFEAASPYIARYPSAVCSMLIAYDYYSDYSPELIYIGKLDKGEEEAIAELKRSYLPNTLIVRGTEDSASIPILEGKIPVNGGASYYLCDKTGCKPVEKNIGDVRAKLTRAKEYVVTARG